MFQKLRQRWQVSPLQLFLILLTFATGGSLCGWLGRRMLSLFNLHSGVIWFIAYLLLITLLWPLCVLIISILTGQFSFFSRYLRRIFNRMSGKKTPAQARLAIFASGGGSNAEKIIQYFENQNNKSVATPVLVVTNNPAAGVINIARNAGIPVLEITRERFINGDAYLPELSDMGITHVILAGFLWKLPKQLISAFPEKILNIHPALLPRFGGKGMYGHFVHEAVIAAKEKKSGLTIHLVDEAYDHGKHLFQAECMVSENETPDSLAKKILALEHLHYPSVIKEFIENAKS